ncbi:SulP family inorganic anion transporter [Aquisalimonas sp.]|uniref:SulP family inorganic anion transporter n=1 Tax=unclassified Aquisalimonas TaxID=2644645 RepID=UPI0025C57269|nr:SulP family inorganic anion transporter [Aquisalimonas sp.]
MTKLLPGWVRRYRRDLLPGDLLAAVVVTMLLVPQGLAYAALAGLPPQLGLYASVTPLLAYAVFGSSMVLSVGPVAVASLMTASALTPLADPGSPEYIAGAVLLAFLSGIMLFVFGLLRLGNLARLMSHPVISGFISGAALLIIVGQLRPLLGVDADGQSALALVVGLVRSMPDVDPLTAAIGVGVLSALLAARIYLPGLLRRLGVSPPMAALGSRLAPMGAVIGVSALVAVAGLEHRLDVVGALPAGLPQLVLPALDPALITPLLLPALIIGLIGFVESVAIAQAFARQRGQRIDPDAELRGLGAANVVSALSGAFPVTGGFSRTAVNAEGGARTPLAGIIAAALIALVLVFATGLFRALPMTVLAAVIIIAAVGLVDVAALRRVWRHDRMEGLAFAGTALGVLVVGVEAGVLFGVTLSLITLIWRASHPHVAVVGRVPGTEHFRNVCRHRVETDGRVLLVRIDENLFFGNAEVVQQQIETLVARDPQPEHLVLVMTSVSHVDATALDMLEALDAGLERQGIRLHLAEVKGPVMDGLSGGPLMERLRGEVFLSVNEAFETLAEPERNQ